MSGVAVSVAAPAAERLAGRWQRHWRSGAELVGRARIEIQGTGLLVEGRRGGLVRSIVYVLGCSIGVVGLVVAVLAPPVLSTVAAIVIAQQPNRPGNEEVLIELGVAIAIVSLFIGVLGWAAFRAVVLPRFRERIEWADVASLALKPDGAWIVLDTRYGPVSGHLGREAPHQLRLLQDRIRSGRGALPEEEPKDRVSPLWLDRTIQVAAVIAVVLGLTGIWFAGGLSRDWSSRLSNPTPFQNASSAIYRSPTDEHIAACAKRLYESGTFGNVSGQIYQRYPGVDAEEVANTSVFDACERCSRKPCRNEAAFFTQVAMNGAVSEMRRYRNVVPRCDLDDMLLTEGACSEDDSDQVLFEKRWAVVRQEIECLEERPRKVIKARLRNTPVPQIAAEMGMAESQVKDAWKNGIRRVSKRAAAACELD